MSDPKQRGTFATLSAAPETAAPTLKETLESLAKVAALIIVCLYLIGFLAVNRYLYGLGVSDFSLVQARFIYTGTLVTSFIIFTVASIAFGVWILRLSSIFIDQGIFRRSVRDLRLIDRLSFLLLFTLTIIVGVFFCLLPWLVFAYFVDAFQCRPMISVSMFVRYGILRGDMFWRSELPYSLSLFATSSIIAAIVYFYVARVSRTYLDEKTKLRHQALSVLFWSPTSFILAVTLVGSLIVYLGLFLEFIYPQVPEQFGGGRPKVVRLLFEETAAKSVGQLGLELTETNYSGLESLLFEGSETYVLSVPTPDQGSIVQINKDMVEAIRIVTLSGAGC